MQKKKRQGQKGKEMTMAWPGNVRLHRGQRCIHGVVLGLPLRLRLPELLQPEPVQRHGWTVELRMKRSHLPHSRHC